MKAITESGKTITIEDKYEVKRGGEGKILTIPELPGQVAKIYLQKNYQHMSLAQKEALSVLDSTLFVKPLALIFNKPKKSDIIGFTMDYLPPDFIPLTAFFSKNFCAANNLDEKFKIALAKKLVFAVQSAHQKDIIIGDLSGLNVLVNLQGEVKFLDVDSYETPVHTHWGLLFDEIRDYLYQGIVSEESDYFALAVLIFSLFTHLHPFKGIHKKYRAMADRMIKKIPVFAQDPDLTLPKCYSPLQNTHLQTQFERLFLKGERFPLTIGQPVTVADTPTPIAPVVILRSALQTKEIYKLAHDEVLQKACFTQSLGYIQTNRQVLLYDVSNQGYVTLKNTLPQKQDVTYFVGEGNFFTLINRELHIFTKEQEWLKIGNLQASNQARYQQIGSILVVLDKGYMRFLYLDQVIQDQIHIQQTPVFTPGFHTVYGLIQNTGGVQYVFYLSGNTISTVKSSIHLQAVHITGSVGIATYEEKLAGETTLHHEYFSIQNLQMQLSGQKVEKQKNVAYKSTSVTQGLVFESADDKLLVRKSDNFAILQEMECSLLSTESNLAMTQAGIIAYEKDFCYLLNTK